MTSEELDKIIAIAGAVTDMSLDIADLIIKLRAQGANIPTYGELAARRMEMRLRIENEGK